MVGLHRGDHSQLGHALHVRRPQVLGVFHAQAPPWSPGQGLEDVQQGGHGPVADGVDGHVEAAGVGGLHTPLHHPLREHLLVEQPAVARFVRIGLEEQGCAGTQRTIGEALESDEAQPVGAEAGLEVQLQHGVHLGDREEQGDPGGQPALQQQVLVDSETPLAGDVVHRGHALGGGLVQRGLGPGPQLARGGLRDMPVDHVPGRVLQHAGGLAPGVPDDRPAIGGGGVAIQPGQAQRQAVAKHHVAVHAADADWMARGGRVDPVPAGQLRVREVLVVPVAAQDPLPFGQLPGLGGDPGGEFGWCLGAVQLHAQQGLPTLDEVDVAVGEAWEHQAPLEIKHPGARADPGLKFPGGTHAHDALAHHRHGFRPGVGRVHRIDPRVGQYQISTHVASP